MPNIFEITPGIRELARMALDDMVDQLGKPCRLYHAPSLTPCPNCLVAVLGNGQRGKSSGRYKQGGPTAFPFGSKCPVCNGEGSISGAEVTEVVTMLTEMAPAKFWVDKLRWMKDESAQLPGGLIQTKFYARDLPKVLKAREMVVTTLEALQRYRYILAGEPISPGNIVQDRYIICTWRRAG